MFKVGDEVVCVDAEFLNDNCPLTRLTEGSVYVVEAVYPDGEGCLCHNSPYMLDLVGVPSDPEWAYAACSFRKVERKSDNFSIEAFLTIKPNQFEGPKRTNQPAKRKEKA